MAAAQERGAKDDVGGPGMTRRRKSYIGGPRAKGLMQVMVRIAFEHRRNMKCKIEHQE